MWEILKSRLLVQKYRTGAFPVGAPNLPEEFVGRPMLDNQGCATCQEHKCSQLCPTGALKHDANGVLELDSGKCLFCGECRKNCPAKAITNTREYRLGAFRREKLIVRSDDCNVYEPERHPESAPQPWFGKSLKLRQVSAGGCAACELDFNVLNTLAWDMGRFGIQAVASPRHADGLLITGPVSNNMLLALKKTYAAIPRPAIVIACGTCAISGGLYDQSECCNRGIEEILPVDLYVPGCPPHPATLLEALLRLMNSKALIPRE